MLTILVIIIGDTILHIYSLTQLLLRFFSSWNTWLWKIITCCYQPEKWERDRLYATPENLCNVHKNQLKYETIVPLAVLKFLFSSDCCIFKPIPYAFPPLNCIRSTNLQARARWHQLMKVLFRMLFYFNQFSSRPCFFGLESV